MSITIAIANTLEAFLPKTVGTKVTNEHAFNILLANAVEAFDFSSVKVAGQAFIPLPPGTENYVSCGEGRHTTNPEDYHKVEYRGVVRLYLNRDKAYPVGEVAAVIYDEKAYRNDPEVDEAEAARVAGSTHVLVSVIASVEPNPPRTAARFIAGLAGGNNEYAWMKDGTCPDSKLRQTVVELSAEAEKVKKYDKMWGVVAD